MNGHGICGINNPNCDEDNPNCDYYQGLTEEEEIDRKFDEWEENERSTP